MTRFALLLLLCWICVIGATPAFSASESSPKPEIAGVQVGLAGHYKAGLWTPVRVTLRGVDGIAQGQVTLTVPDADGVPSRVSSPLPSAEDGQSSETSVLLYARFGRVKGQLAVEVSLGDEVLDRRVFNHSDGPGFRPAVSSERDLIVTVGPSSTGLEEALGTARYGQEKAVVARLDSLCDLPSQWHGYEGVHTLVISTSDPQCLSGLTADSDRIAALDEWVQMGGKLILFVGSRGEEVLCRRPEAALSRFAPGRLEKMVPLLQSRFIALETYSNCSVSIPPPKGKTQIPYLVEVQGRIEARDGVLPLVVRTTRGFGQVMFVAADLDLHPFADWPDRKLLLAALLGLPATPVDEDDQGTAVMHYGFNNMAGQLRSALDQFAGISVLPFGLAVALIFLYILAIGPGDYFFLRKVARRMQLTWITFPLIVVAFSVTAYILAHRSKGDRILVNQIDLVDVDAASGRLRGTAWANVFTPRTDRYDFAFQPQLPGGESSAEAKTITAWLGLTGGALGGMDPRTVEPEIWRGHYAFSERLDSLSEVPMQVWSTKSLTARWTAPIDPLVEARLVNEDAVPVGTVSNSLDVPLTECLLAYRHHAYELGTIGPGQSVGVGPTLRRRELKSLLTGQQIVLDDKDDFRQEITPYDQASLDPLYVLRAMIFFAKAGGRLYTGLSNQYQGFVDLSDLLKTDRAILVARIPQDDTAAGQYRGADLTCDGKPIPDAQVNRTTLYRFVFPVQTAEARRAE